MWIEIEYLKGLKGIMWIYFSFKQSAGKSFKSQLGELSMQIRLKDVLNKFF